MKFRMKPVVIDAVRWGGDLTAIDEIVDGIPQGVLSACMAGARIGDWIIRDANGNLYPKRADTFYAMYEEIDDLGNLHGKIHRCIGNFRPGESFRADRNDHTEP